MKHKIKKNRLKIFIALSLMITCIFGVMFATNTFAYNTTNNNNITNTIENITNYSFNNIEYKTIINGNNTKQYIELQRTSSNNAITFNIKNDYLTDTNYNNYTLFINYDYGWYSNGVWRSYNNGPNVNINLSLYINASQTNTTSQYLYSNMLNDTTFNYSYRTNAIYNNRYTDLISSSTTFYLQISQQASSSYYLRIYNIDFVNNNDITFSYYYDNIYQQYNQLLNDYEDLELDYSQLNNDYNTLEYNYNTLEENYNYLDEQYNTLSNTMYLGNWGYLDNFNWYSNNYDETYTLFDMIDNDMLDTSNGGFYIYKWFLDRDYGEDENGDPNDGPRGTIVCDFNFKFMPIDFLYFGISRCEYYDTDITITLKDITNNNIYIRTTGDQITGVFTQEYLENLYGASLDNTRIETIQIYNLYIEEETSNNKKTIVYSENQINSYYYSLGFNNGVDSQQNNINQLSSQIENLTITNQNMQTLINALDEQIRAFNSDYNLNNLMWTIGSVPFESFKQIWNVNFFGVNVADFFLGFVTFFIALFVVKKFFL